MKLVKMQKDPTNKVVRKFLTKNDYIERKKAIYQINNQIS